MENLKTELKKIKSILDKTETIYIVNRTAYIVQDDNSLITIKDINIGDCEIFYTKRGEVLTKTKNETFFTPKFKILGTELEQLNVDLNFLKANKNYVKDFNFIFVTNNEKLIVTDSHIMFAEEDLKTVESTTHKFNAKYFKVLMDNKINVCTITEKNELIIEFDNIKIEYIYTFTGTNIIALLSQDYKTNFTLKIDTIYDNDMYIDFDNRNFNELNQIEFRLHTIHLKELLKRFNEIKIETIGESGFIKSALRINDKVLLMPCLK